MYVVGIVLLVVGEAIALAKTTDKQEPLTHYLRAIFHFGPITFLIGTLIWVWVGLHLLYVRDGYFPF